MGANSPAVASVTEHWNPAGGVQSVEVVSPSGVSVFTMQYAGPSGPTLGVHSQFLGTTGVGAGAGGVGVGGVTGAGGVGLGGLTGGEAVVQEKMGPACSGNTDQNYYKSTYGKKKEGHTSEKVIINNIHRWETQARSPSIT